ncbi:MAG: sigma factor, partial [Phycicoccus sp.]
MTDDEARRALTTLLRESGRDVLATLARTTGDLQLAEDAVQDATVTALEVWSRTGVPPNPVAWLRLTARRRAI